MLWVADVCKILGFVVPGAILIFDVFSLIFLFLLFFEIFEIVEGIMKRDPWDDSDSPFFLHIFLFIDFSIVFFFQRYEHATNQCSAWGNTIYYGHMDIYDREFEWKVFKVI